MHTGFYLPGVILAGFIGFSSVFTVAEITNPVEDRVRTQLLRQVAERPENFLVRPLAVTVQMQTDGWTRYETTVSQPYEARWTVVLLGPDGTRLCSGFGDSEYTFENQGPKYWGADYFTGDDCPDAIPFGSRGTVTYTPYSAEFLPLIVDFVVREVSSAGYDTRPPVTQ